LKHQVQHQFPTYVGKQGPFQWKTEYRKLKLCFTTTCLIWTQTYLQIASIQSELGYPGLIRECKVLVEQLKLPNIRKTSLSKAPIEENKEQEQIIAHSLRNWIKN
jgi:hypothetical protein